MTTIPRSPSNLLKEATEAARTATLPASLFCRGFGVSQLAVVLDPDHQWPQWLEELVNFLYDSDFGDRNENSRALLWARWLARTLDDLPTGFDWKEVRDRYLVRLLDELAPHDTAAVVAPVRELLRQRLAGQEVEAKLQDARHDAASVCLENHGKGRVSIVASITGTIAEGQVVDALSETPLLFRDDRVRRMLVRAIADQRNQGGE